MEKIERSLHSTAELTRNGSLGLVDSGLTSYGVGNWYDGYLYYIHSFTKIDADVLFPVLTKVEQYQDLLSIHSIHSVPKAAQEVQRMRTILTDKLKFLNRTANTRDARKQHHTNLDASELRQIAKDLLENICWNYREAERLTRRKQLSPSGDAFKTLDTLISSITTELCSKKNYALRHGDSPYVHGEDLHTDEQLVATAIFYSIFRNQSCYILTADSDIARIVQNTYWFLTEETQPLANAVKLRLNEVPVKVFFKNGDDSFEGVTDTSDLSREYLTRNLWLNNKLQGSVRKFPLSPALLHGFSEIPVS